MKMDYVKSIIKKYEDTGRIAFLHPRSKTISLNGGRELPYNEAIIKMRDCINDEMTA